jgi:glutamyl-tRNA synthetase
MIHGADGKKLSKRHGATAVGDYQHLGILPQAMLNFLALLGWSPGNDIEVMTVEQMIELFSTEGLLKKAAVFDTKKLEWMNGQHLSMMPAEALARIVTPQIIAAGLASGETLEKIHQRYMATLDLLKVRARTTDDIVRQAKPYLTQQVEYEPEAVSKGWKDRAGSAETLAAVQEALSSLETWDQATLEDSLKRLAETRGLSAGKLYQPMRVALTGLTVSPGIFEIMGALGRDLSLRRLADAHAWLLANGA